MYGLLESNVTFPLPKQGRRGGREEGKEGRLWAKTRQTLKIKTQTKFLLKEDKTGQGEGKGGRGGGGGRGRETLKLLLFLACFL